VSPSRLARPCNHYGCGAVTVARYCPKHAPLHPVANWRQMPANVARAHVYDRRHAAWRKRVLALHPVCACGARATEAHHIVPVRDGGAPYDVGNGRGLCHDCHSAETAREIQRRRRRGK